MKAITAQTRAILFDHDGTLIDSERTHFELWCDVVKDVGVTLTHDFYCDVMAGMPVKQNARDLVTHFGLNVAAQTLADKKFSALDTFLATQAFPLMAGAKEAVRACADAGYTLAVVTGGSGMSVRRTIEMYGLDGCFSTIVAAEDVQHGKPAPECYLTALAQLGLGNDQAVAVEDTVHGMHAALNAGLHCVVIPGAHSSSHDFTAATVIYSSLDDWLNEELKR